MRKLYSFFVAMLVCIATSAADYTLSATVGPDFSNYVIDEAYYPAQEIADKLGIDTEALEALIATNQAFYLQLPDGTRTNENYSDPNQPWMNAQSVPQGYGDAGTCWFAGIAYAPAEDGTPSVNAWLGDMPGFFKSVYEPTDLSATFFLVNGDKEVSFEFNLHVEAAEVTAKDLSQLTIVKELAATLSFTEGGQYEGKTLEVDLTAAAEVLGTDTATLALSIAKMVYTQAVSTDPESGESTISQTLDLPENLSGGAWFGRYRDYSAEDIDAMLLQNAPMNWASGCTFYLQNPAMADGIFTLTYGQYPGTLKAGAKDYADLYIVNGDQAVKLTVTVDVKAAESVPFTEMTEVAVVDIVKEQYPTTDYSSSTFSIDMAAAADMLGCTATDVTLFPLKDAESLYTGSSTANNGGWWFNKDGYVCSWGSGSDGSYFFIEPAESGVYSAMNIGQFPGDYQVGDSAVTNLYLLYGSQYVRYHVVLNIVEKQTSDPDTRILAGNRTITVKQLPNDGYVWSSNEGQGTVGIIKAQDLYNLIGTTDPVLYGEVADSTGVATWTDSYTMGEKPGFWMTSEGYAANWGNNTTWGMTSQMSTTGATGGDWGFACMQFPGSGLLGNSFQGTFYLLNPENNKYIKVTLISKVVEEVSDDEVVGEESITVPVAVDGTEVEFDLSKVAEALSISVDDLMGGLYLHGATGAANECSTGLQFSENGTVYEEGDGAFGLVFDNATTMYVFSNMDGEVADDWSVAADIYFDVEGKQYIVHVTFVSPAIYTAINSVKATATNAPIYDLQGRQVIKTQKGIYIQNGRKYIKD